MYKRKRIYKTGYDNLEIAQEAAARRRRRVRPAGRASAGHCCLGAAPPRRTPPAPWVLHDSVHVQGNHARLHRGGNRRALLVEPKDDDAGFHYTNRWWALRQGTVPCIASPDSASYHVNLISREGCNLQACSWFVGMRAGAGEGAAVGEAAGGR
jgi:hypothetical protein